MAMTPQQRTRVFAPFYYPHDWYDFENKDDAIEFILDIYSVDNYPGVSCDRSLITKNELKNRLSFYNGKGLTIKLSENAEGYVLFAIDN